MSNKGDKFWWAIADFLINGGFFLVLGITLLVSIAFSLLVK
jgi:hypothetical protein